MVTHTPFRSMSRIYILRISEYFVSQNTTYLRILRISEYYVSQNTTYLRILRISEYYVSQNITYLRILRILLIRDKTENEAVTLLTQTCAL